MTQWNEQLHRVAEHNLFPTIETTDGNFKMSYNEDNFYTVYNGEGIDIDTVTYDEVPDLLSSNNISSNNWK